MLNVNVININEITLMKYLITKILIPRNIKYTFMNVYCAYHETMLWWKIELSTINIVIKNSPLNIIYNFHGPHYYRTVINNNINNQINRMKCFSYYEVHTTSTCTMYIIWLLTDKRSANQHLNIWFNEFAIYKNMHGF